MPRLNLTQLGQGPTVTPNLTIPAVSATASDGPIGAGGGTADSIIEVPSSTGPHNPQQHPIVGGLGGPVILLGITALIIARCWLSSSTNKSKAAKWLGRVARTPKKRL